MATRVDGIDVSRYQGNVDWYAVRASCATPDMALAAWKVTQGTHTLDPTAATNRTGAAAAGFRWRFGYHWLSANTDAVAQADWFLSQFWPMADGEGVILDCEEAGITVGQVVAWCERVEAVTGRPVAIYTGVHVAGGAIWNSAAIFGSGKRIRWVAAYVSETKVRQACEPYGFDCWQWSSSATVPGVSGRCDVNLIEHPIMCNLATGAVVPSPPAPPIPTSSALLGASTQGVSMLTVVACSDNKADPQRWVWNGIVRHHITDEAEYMNLVESSMLNPKFTLAAPKWMTLLQLAAIPLV